MSSMRRGPRNWEIQVYFGFINYDHNFLIYVSIIIASMTVKVKRFGQKIKKLVITHWASCEEKIRWNFQLRCQGKLLSWVMDNFLTLKTFVQNVVSIIYVASHAWCCWHLSKMSHKCQEGNETSYHRLNWLQFRGVESRVQCSSTTIFFKVVSLHVDLSYILSKVIRRNSKPHWMGLKVWGN